MYLFNTIKIKIPIYDTIYGNYYTYYKYMNRFYLIHAQYSFLRSSTVLI